MTTRIRDYSPLLRQAIAEARAAGFVAEAEELERAAFAAFTTSSEMLQEHTLAITRFLRTVGEALPRATTEKLSACLAEAGLAGTGWRKFIALLKRRRSLGADF